MASPTTEHPLLMEEILESVFQYVTDVRDLKSVRLVCQSWKKESLKQWREHGVLVLEQQTRSSNRSGKYPTMMTDLVLGSGSAAADMKPFRRYRLKNWNFDGNSKDEVQFQEGLGLGGVVTYLHLDHCTFPYSTFLNSLLAKSFPNLVRLVWSNSGFRWADLDQSDLYPRWANANFERRRGLHQLSLRTLEVLTDTDEEEVEDSRGFLRRPQSLIPEHIELLLFGCPNIDELIIRKQERDNCFSPGDRHHDGYMSLFLRHGPLARYDGNTANSRTIRKLDIMDLESLFQFPEGNHASSWWNLKKLEELAVDVGAHTSCEDAKRIFANLGNPETLQVLKAFRAPLKEPYASVPFSGRMDHLRELHLWGTFTTDLAFLRHTPALQTLVLKRSCFDKKYKLEGLLLGNYSFVEYSGDLVEATLERFRGEGKMFFEEVLALPLLEHLEIDYDFSTNTLPVLVAWAPNVTRLKMVLTNGTLELVSRQWPKLSELECLFGSSVDDKGVSCLRQMQDLRKFKLNAYCHQSLLSSSAKDAFLGMSTALRELDICVSDKMSKKSVEELMQVIPRVNVIRNSEWGHQHEECCDQLSFTKKSLFRSSTSNDMEPNDEHSTIIPAYLRDICLIMLCAVPYA